MVAPFFPFHCGRCAFAPYTFPFFIFWFRAYSCSSHRPSYRVPRHHGCVGRFAFSCRFAFWHSPPISLRRRILHTNATAPPAPFPADATAARHYTTLAPVTAPRVLRLLAARASTPPPPPPPPPLRPPSSIDCLRSWFGFVWPGRWARVLAPVVCCIPPGTSAGPTYPPFLLLVAGHWPRKAPSPGAAARSSHR